MTYFANVSHSLLKCTTFLPPPPPFFPDKSFYPRWCVWSKYTNMLWLLICFIQHPINIHSIFILFIWLKRVRNPMSKKYHINYYLWCWSWGWDNILLQKYSIFSKNIFKENFSLPQDVWWKIYKQSCIPFNWNLFLGLKIPKFQDRYTPLHRENKCTKKK